jgi:phage protein D
MNARSAYDTLAPELSVSVNGSPLPAKAAADVINAVVLDDVDAPCMFSLTFVGWDTVEMKPKWIDDALFREGGEVELAIGYRDHALPLMKGEITGLEPDFEEARPPTFTVRGYDRLHRLARAHRTRTFTNCTDSDIASRLASENGMRPKVENSEVALPYVIQHNQTDLEFLSVRAHRIGYEVRVQDRDLIFRPRPVDASPALTLHREIELLSFHPRLSTMGQVSELQVRGWDPAQKKEITARAGVGDGLRQMEGSAAGPSALQKAFDSMPGARVATPVQSQEEADLVAKQGFNEMALGFIRADGVCIGEPKLRAGIVVKVEGIGDRFSGPYYVTSTEHVFGSRQGYRTRFTARRNAS